MHTRAPLRFTVDREAVCVAVIQAYAFIDIAQPDMHGPGRFCVALPDAFS